MLFRPVAEVLDAVADDIPPVCSLSHETLRSASAGVHRRIEYNHVHRVGQIVTAHEVPVPQLIYLHRLLFGEVLDVDVGLVAFADAEVSLSAGVVGVVTVTPLP